MTATLTPFVQYADDIVKLRYAHTVQGRKESWEQIAARVCQAVLLQNNQWNSWECPIPHDTLVATFEAIRDRKFIPGGRILSQAGRPYHQTDNCYCLRAVDTREGWADLAHKCTMMFMSGGGVGVSYDDIRPYGTQLSRSGGIASGPIPLIQMVNSIGAAARQGGERRGAIYASLKWDHPDIAQFIKLKNGNDGLQHTNISVRFDNRFLHHTDLLGKEVDFLTPADKQVFMQTLQHACQWGDPGFQFDNDDQILRNACCEIISRDDGDSCCLGSINLANIDSLAELNDVTHLGVLFLLCNTLYTDLPTEQVRLVKAKNRRIGLGLMGVGEWFIQRGIPYGHHVHFDQNGEAIWDMSAFEIAQWLLTWQQSSDHAADVWADKLQIVRPVATRAIAPTGTISIAGGHTTPGIEPVFHTAYRRTYNTLQSQEHSNGFVTENVIDPVVMKWISEGYDIRDIDTAYTLSQSVAGIERRLAFQAFVQQYVDNAISSTINLPTYVPEIEEAIAPMLLKYLPQLRGVTFYPDGRHSNQPVVPLDIHDVMNGKVEQYESCKLGDSCGS